MPKEQKTTSKMKTKIQSGKMHRWDYQLPQVIISTPPSIKG